MIQRHHPYDEETKAEAYIGTCACCGEAIYQGDAHFVLGERLYACEEHLIEVTYNACYVPA